MTENKFTNLISETDAIRESWGYGFLEALQYIAAHPSVYLGTAVYREYVQFMREAAEMFAPVGE
jgi:hypothetical protein